MLHADAPADCFHVMYCVDLYLFTSLLLHVTLFKISNVFDLLLQYMFLILFPMMYLIKLVFDYFSRVTVFIYSVKKIVDKVFASDVIPLRETDVCKIKVFHTKVPYAITADFHVTFPPR